MLIAEDGPASRKILIKILEKARQKVSPMKNGHKAGELCKEEFFPIDLTDWRMPKMDGIELCIALR